MLPLLDKTAGRVPEAATWLEGATPEQEAALVVGDERARRGLRVRIGDDAVALAARPSRGDGDRPAAARAVTPVVEDPHTGYRTPVSPRFVPASVAELQRVGLFASLPGETLRQLAERAERLEAPSGASFGGTETTVDVLLSGLARGGGGLLRPGDVAESAATAVTACVVARIPRDALATAVDAPET